MIKKSFLPLFCLLLIAFVSYGCGKKQNETGGVDETERTDPGQGTEIEEELDKQELFCGASSCPSYIAKIAFLHKDKFKYCTGFLTADNQVATASSCLPEKLRVRDLPCGKEVFIFLANSNYKPIRLGCKKVLEVSQSNAKEPFLWRSDVAYLELDTNDRRKSASPTRLGMNDLDKFYVWSVDQIDDHQGIIRRSENCQSVHNSYLNPLASNESSPVMTLAGCPFNEGNAGSPVLDLRGRVRGMVSAPVDEKEIAKVLAMRILEGTLKTFSHATNFACAPIFPEQDVLNETECGKKLDIRSYDVGQFEMIFEATLFRPALLKIEHALNQVEKNQYLRLATKLVPGEDLFEVDIYPRCFKNVSSWIDTFTGNPKDFQYNMMLPRIKLKKVMNEFGKVTAKEISEGNEKTYFSFNPRVLRTIRTNAPRQANLYMWSTGNPSTIFANLTESCGSLF